MPTQESVQELDLLQAARCEDLVYEQIGELTVLGDLERKIVDTLKQSGAHLLQGARGVGKSMLLRQAEIEMDVDFQRDRKLGVYVNFKTSTLLEGVKAGERDAFQVWVGAKILQALYDKLIFLDLVGHEGIIDPYNKIFGVTSVQGIKDTLKEKVHQLQRLAMVQEKQELISEIGADFIARVNDVTFLHDLLKEIVDVFNIEKLVLLFDEAAHTFIPSQQEIFFEIFKLLHGGKIAVKAAVYPSVTSYGRNFEVGQDAIVLTMDRFETGSIGRNANRTLFRDMLTKRIPKGSVAKQIFSKGYLLDQCIDLSTGNPRAFFHLFIRTIDKGYTDRGLLLATQEFVDQELLPYHQNLSKRLPKFAHHVKVGLDLLRGYVIPEMRNKNFREKKSGYQSAFFTVQRDMSPNLKLALDILCYSGVLTSQGTVKIAERRTGLRYMVHLCLLFTEKAFSAPSFSDAMRSLSLTDYREFSSSDRQIEAFLASLKEAVDKCPNCSTDIPPNAKFCSECGTKVETTSIISALLDEPISAISISERLRLRVEPHYPRVGDVIQARREDLMKIKWIKEVRSRIIKNAAEEFISG
ncbi:MAG: zinc ribbon domain-containing protein [Thermodesulfobacteriota bacterium]